MSRFLFNKAAEIEPVTKVEKISKFLQKSNEIYKIFLNNFSWLIYLTGSLLILCSICYYFYDRKRRLDLRRHREDLQRAAERIPQRRRPGAIYRDHQIFRNAISTVRQYMGINAAASAKQYVLKRTRSGAIYGKISDSEET